MTTIWVLEAIDTSTAGNLWTESACGDTGIGLTQFDTEADARAAFASLLALGEGWTAENTRVRDTSIPAYERSRPDYR